MLFDLIKTTDFSDRTEITLPYYFDGSEEPLTLTARLYDGQVYLSDNARAYTELKKKAEGIAEKMADYFACVCFELKLNEKKELIIPVNNGKDFFRLIQAVSLVANAYKYTEVDGYYMDFHLPYCEEAITLSDTVKPEEFIKKLLEELRLDDSGEECLIKLPFYFPDEPCPMWMLFSKNSMTLTDIGDFDGGNIIVRIEIHNGGEPCDNSIVSLCELFGCTYAGAKIYYKLENGTELSRGIFNFLQMASVVGVLERFVFM